MVPTGPVSASVDRLPDVPRRLYRSVRSRDPGLDDFKSHGALGKQSTGPIRSTANLRNWFGLSVFVTYEQAWANADHFGWDRLGEYIAELEIPDNAPMTFDDPNHKGHLNIHDADPAYLKACVRRVVHGPSTLTLSNRNDEPDVLQSEQDDKP